MVCQICVTPSRIRHVKCEYCDYISCERCICTIGKITCANCMKEWSINYIKTKFTTKTVNILKNKQADALFIEFETYINLTRDLLTRECKFKQRKAEISVMLKRQRIVIDLLSNAYALEKLNKNASTTILLGIKRQCADARLKYNQLDSQSYDELLELTHSKFISIQCPLPECRGSIPINTSICIVCGSHACLKCLTICDDKATHVCDPNILLTLGVLSIETKPCPVCRTPIQKTNGCDVMFCINPTCKTFFNWSTLQIQRMSHNPDHVRFQAEHGRDIMDDVCGGPPSGDEFRDRWYIDNPVSYTYYQYHLSIYLYINSMYRNSVEYASEYRFHDLALQVVSNGTIDINYIKKVLLRRKISSSFYLKFTSLLRLLKTTLAESMLIYYEDNDTEKLLSNSSTVAKCIIETFNEDKKLYKIGNLNRYIANFIHKLSKLVIEPIRS